MVSGLMASRLVCSLDCVKDIIPLGFTRLLWPVRPESAPLTILSANAQNSISDVVFWNLDGSTVAEYLAAATGQLRRDPDA